jgi:hypothetical protein
MERTECAVVPMICVTGRDALAQQQACMQVDGGRWTENIWCPEVQRYKSHLGNVARTDVQWAVGRMPAPQHLPLLPPLPPPP